MLNEKQVKTTKIITASIVALVCVLALVLVLQFVKINNLRQKQTTLNSQLENLEKDIYNYSEQNTYLNSPDYLEDYAREVLRYGKTNETHYKKAG